MLRKDLFVKYLNCDGKNLAYKINITPESAPGTNQYSMSKDSLDSCQRKQLVP